MEKVCKNEEDKELSNSYAPEFIEYFLKKLAPFMPLIAPFLWVIKGQRSVNRSSNAVVEGSFNQLKMHIRESSELHLNDWLDRIFSAERLYIDGFLKPLMYKIKSDRRKERLKL